MPAGYAAVHQTLCISGKEKPHNHGCPVCCSGTHLVIGKIMTGSPTVVFEGRLAARATDQGDHLAPCCGVPPGVPAFLIPEAGCSETVRICGLRAARAEDPTQHCGSIEGKIDKKTCCKTVMIGA